MMALMQREYGWSLREFLGAEPSLTHALAAAACEHAGMTGAYTYRDMEIREHIDEIMAGKAAHLGY